MKVYKIIKKTPYKDTFICNVGIRTSIKIPSNDKSKKVLLSNKPGGKISTPGFMEAIEALRLSYVNKTPLKFTFIEKKYTGWVVEYQSIRCFIPNNYFIFTYEVELGSEYMLYVVTLDLSNKNIVCSKSPYKLDDSIAEHHFLEHLISLKQKALPITFGYSIIHCNKLFVFKLYKPTVKDVSFINSITEYKRNNESFYKVYLTKELPIHLSENAIREGSISNGGEKTYIRLTTGLLYKSLITNLFSTLSEAILSNKTTQKFNIIKGKIFPITPIDNTYTEKYYCCRIFHKKGWNICFKTLKFIKINVTTPEARIKWLTSSKVFVNQSGNIIL